jgi:hypothetical protein
LDWREFPICCKIVLMKAHSLCAIAVLSLPLAAGVRVQMETTDLSTQKVTTTEMLVDSTRIRVNTGSSTSMLFLTDGGRNRMVTLDRNRNEYREMDQQYMDQMAKQMNSAMAMMEEQMKNMPPQQREMMEKMMKGKMPQMAAQPQVPTIYTAKGSDTVNGFACTKYEGTRNGEKVAEVCAASPAALKFVAADSEVFEKMREFMSGYVRALQNSPLARMYNSEGSSAITETGFKGIPVRQIRFRGGKPEQLVEFKTVELARFSDEDFSVGNAKKIELPAVPSVGR